MRQRLLHDYTITAAFSSEPLYRSNRAWGYHLHKSMLALSTHYLSLTSRRWLGVAYLEVGIAKVKTNDQVSTEHGTPVKSPIVEPHGWYLSNDGRTH